ncbi:MAG: TRAP transporter substrate-binding protein DctP [Magnetococcales bacterium]|nr:TRAP transporter substrate-binding protein DctP [Magnetococcales bacterium]
MRRFLLLFVVLAVVSASVQAAPPTEGGIPMRLTAIHKADMLYVQALAKLTRAIDETTGKQIRPERFTSGQKGSEAETLLEQIQGNLEGGYISAISLAQQLPAFQTLAIPLLFTKPEHVRAFIGSQLDIALRETAKSKKLLVLGYASSGFYGILNFRPGEPKEAPPSLSNLIVRIPKNPWMVEVHQSLGLRPFTLPSADLPDAITSGWVQGVSATPEILNRTSFINTTASAFHHTRHLHGWMVLVLNLEWFNRLNPDLQTAITNAANSVLPQSLEQSLAQEQKILNKWSSDKLFSILTPEPTDEMKNLALKTAGEMEKLLNLPGVITQGWEKNQLVSAPSRSDNKKLKPRATP